MASFDTPVSLLIASVVVIVSLLLPKRNRLRAPRIGGEPGLFGFFTLYSKIRFLVSGRALVYKQYKADKNKPYYLETTFVDRLILPPKYLPELRDQEVGKFNATLASSINALGEYCGVDVILRDRQTHDLCQGRLARSLPLVIPVLAKELRTLLHKKLEGCTTAVSVALLAHALVVELNHEATALTLVGPDLSGDREWKQAFLSILPTIQGVILGLAPLPRILRKVVAPVLPATRRLRTLHERLRRILFTGKISKTIESGAPTFVQFLVETSKTSDEEEIVAKLCVLVTNMTHLLAISITNALFDLCCMPLYVPDLRAELDEALESTSGEFTFETMKQMRKMDSFLKESQRWTPPSYLQFSRVVLDDIVLSDGSVLPKGEFVSMPTGPLTRDPDYYENPNTFDGYRFYRKASEAKEDTSRYELSGIDEGSLHWGQGRFTCPGRWYASAVMKLVLGLIILEYDIAFPEGQTERKEDTYLDTMVQPSEKQVLVFRRRK